MPLADPFSSREVWFLTGSIGLYGEDVLQRVAEQSRGVLAALQDGDVIPVRIVWKPVLTGSDAIRKVALEANADDAVIGVIAWMHTFSPAKMWIRGLVELHKPLLHLHTQANVELPYADIDFDFMNLNQSAHGDREFAYIQTRLGLDRAIAVGHASQPRTRERVATWARAAAAWSVTRSLRLARFGDNMRHVAVTEGDKTEAEIRLGAQVNTWSVNELADEVHAADAAAVDEVVSECLRQYAVAPGLRPDGARHEALRYAAAIEVGLRAFLTRGGFEAFTTNFEDLSALRQLPGLAVQRLAADGYGFGPEGDWKTAILGRAAAVMGWGLPGGASLMEDYTYDLVEGRELILGSHMLEVNPTLTASRPSLEIHPLGIGVREDPVRLVFSADPGPGIVVSMTDMRDRFRLVANVVDVVAEPAPMPRLPVGRALWSPRPDFVTATTSWLLAGGAHHTVMSTAVGMGVLEDFARMARMELVAIDEDTRLADVERRLRSDGAHFSPRP